MGEAPTEGGLEPPEAGAEDFTRLVQVEERDLGGRQVLAVLARDLHGAVGSADHFTHWLADKVDQCQLRSAIDYEEVFREKAKNPLGGRPRREVAFTLNAAKEIGMAARGDYGKLLRRYFLDCEFRLPARLLIEDAMVRRAGGAAPGGPADRET